MNIKFSPPDITQEEIDGVVEVLKSGWITTGPKTKLFETEISKYLQTERTVCLNSATACLELTLKVLGIGEGDEVITSAYTYTASASVINHVGAKIVLCDTEENSYQMDYSKLESLITTKTKAIIPVDIAGVPCDYKQIFEIANKNKSIFKPSNSLQEKIGRICIIEDAAHSFGATIDGKQVGNLADFTCFSFHAVKNLTTAEGGAVTWTGFSEFNDEIYNKFMLFSLHGQNKDALSKTKIGSFEYDIKTLGYKCNMTDIMAAIGLAQLKRYPSLLKRRKEIVNKYDNAFANSRLSILKHFTDNYSSSGHLYLTRIIGADENERNEVFDKLAEYGICANVHYKPLPMHTAYKNIGFDIKDFPNAFNMYKNEITLPLNSLLTDVEIDYVIEKYLGIIKNKV